MGERPFMATNWTHLAMVSFEVDPAILKPFVPLGTELDEFNGRYLVSIVGFLYSDTRVFGMAVPGHRSFPELNLRFYIRYRASERWRRGVAFIKEIVPLRAVTWIARMFYDENFFTHPTRYRIDVSEQDRRMRVEYAWKIASDWNKLAVISMGTPALPAQDSEERFITEHYWGYTARRDGTTSEYHVEHPPWRVTSAECTSFKCDVAAMYGQPFVEALSREPSSVLLAEGSPVAVYRGNKLAAAIDGCHAHSLTASG